jgi:hypothetical protein
MEVEVELHAILITAKWLDHVPDALPPGDESAVPTGQEDVGLQN